MTEATHKRLAFLERDLSALTKRLTAAEECLAMQATQMHALAEEARALRMRLGEGPLSEQNLYPHARPAIAPTENDHNGRSGQSNGV